jgi:hypothetical protein
MKLKRVEINYPVGALIKFSKLGMSFDHVNDLRMELEYSPPYELYEDH